MTWRHVSALMGIKFRGNFPGQSDQRNNRFSAHPSFAVATAGQTVRFAEGLAFEKLLDLLYVDEGCDDRRGEGNEME
jgi:hypothetical protein